MKTYRRVIIFLAILCSVILVERIVNLRGRNYDEELMEVFMQTPFEMEETRLNIWTQWSVNYMEEQDMRQVVEELADYLGLEDYEIETTIEKERQEIVLTKQSAHGNTKIQMIEILEPTIFDNTFKATSYLVVDICLTTHCKSITYYKKHLTKFFEERGYEPTVNTVAIGSKDGKVSKTEASEVAKSFIKSLGAEVKGVYDHSSIYNVYGYLDNFGKYIETNGSKINLDIALTYDEEKDKTYFYSAVPIINFDY